MKFFLSACLFFLLFCSCRYNGFQHIKGNGVQANQQRSIPDFRRLHVNGPVDVFITQDANPSVRIEGDENLLSYVETRNDGDQLIIGIRNGYNLDSRSGLRVYVAGPNYESISLTGSGDLKSTNKLTGNNISLNITGSGDAVLNVDAPNIKTEISGSGSIRINGETENFDSRINGSGELYAYNLLSENTSVRIAGSADAQVYASKKLDIHIAGAGDVGYKGNPVVTQHIAGSGDVHREQ
jgi:hypothetical protein